jgi:hypothetical protein
MRSDDSLVTKYFYKQKWPSYWREMYLQGVLICRLSTERAQRLFFEVDRAAHRLEQLAEGRRERLRDLARVRALEDETTQVRSLRP